MPPLSLSRALFLPLCACACVCVCLGLLAFCFYLLFRCLPKKESLKQAKIRNTYSFVNRSSGEKKGERPEKPQKENANAVGRGERKERESGSHTHTPQAILIRTIVNCLKADIPIVHSRSHWKKYNRKLETLLWDSLATDEIKPHYVVSIIL